MSLREYFAWKRKFKEEITLLAADTATKRRKNLLGAARDQLREHRLNELLGVLDSVHNASATEDILKKLEEMEKNSSGYQG